MARLIFRIKMIECHAAVRSEFGFETQGLFGENMPDVLEKGKPGLIVFCNQRQVLCQLRGIATTTYQVRHERQHELSSMVAVRRRRRRRRGGGEGGGGGEEEEEAERKKKEAARG